MDTISIETIKAALGQLWTEKTREYEHAPNEYLRGQLNAIRVVELTIDRCAIKTAVESAEDIMEWARNFMAQADAG